MKYEIERKFLIRTLPDISGFTPIKYQRYFLPDENGYTVRIQQKGERYEIEKKKEISNLRSVKEKTEITKDEFNRLKLGATTGIGRESYQLSIIPNISLKIYTGRFSGLVRAEVEFDTEEEANTFIPFIWMGEEITNSPLGKDSTLINLNEEEFGKLLGKNV